MSPTPSLRAISKARFKVAQYALVAAVAAESAAAISGVTVGLQGRWAGALTLTVVLLAIVARGVRQVSSSQTARANELLSTLDFSDGLGRPIPAEKRADWLAGVSRPMETLALRQDTEAYFDSKEPASPRRLVENVKESAWWSKTLSSELADLSSLLVVILVVAALFLLLAPIVGLVASEPGTATGQWILALVLLLISQGPWGLAREYSAFASGAERIQDAAVRLLEKYELSETEAVELSLTYHLTRQGAPVIPSWWHSYRRHALNRAWKASTADRLQQEDRGSVAT